CRTLHQLGLPANLSPRKAQQQLVAAAQLDRLKKLLQQRRQEAQQRREELSGCVKRVGELYEEVGLVPVHPRLTDQVQQLSRASAEQQEWIERRSTLLKESHQHRRQQLTILRQLHKWHHRRRQLLENAEAESADEFRELAGMYAESVTLKERRKRIKDQLGAAICGVCQPPELAEQMKGATAPQLERRWEKLAAKLEEVDQQLKEAFEKRGRLTEQLRSLADDRRGGQQRLELNCVRQQFREAVSRWRQLAVISCLLQSIRRRYEEERQPATLCEASQYLKQLTDGRYHRIWTLLDEDALCVDDQHGHSLTPENLSRGTREQLFLALRMALVTQYAQRGVQLPLVLDDVLVNFDSHRAQAAAAVLLDFARLGHQVLIFTCHEHLLEIFGSLGSDTRRLPGEGPPPMATPARKSHRRKKKPLPAAVPAPAPAVETEPRPQPSSAKASSATPPSAKTSSKRGSSKRGSSKRGPARKQKQTPAEPAPASPVSPPQIAQPVLTAERSAGEENTWEVDDEELRQVPSTLSPHDAARPADTPLDSPPGRSQEPPTKITEAA
ncbi:MAG: hypothetical protein GTO03_16765, partial [Planctomycetales bacterium]|nr:hypothetical protein [Planctomycetales bacterium]